jgi:hypothetical protein
MTAVIVYVPVETPNFGPLFQKGLLSFKRILQKNEENKSCRKTLDLQICSCSYLVHDSSKEAMELAKNKFPWGPKLEAFTVFFKLWCIWLSWRPLSFQFQSQGLLYAHRLSFTVRLVMNLHARLQKPMSKAEVAGLCRLIELLQFVRTSYHRHAAFLAEASGSILQYLSWVALTVLGSAKVNKLELRELYNQEMGRNHRL